MTRKSGQRFFEKVMPKRVGMTRKNGQRFSDQIMPKIEDG